MNILLSDGTSRTGIAEIMAKVPDRLDEVQIANLLNLKYQDVQAKHQTCFLLGSLRQRAATLKLKFSVDEMSVESLSRILEKDIVVCAAVAVADRLVGRSGRDLFSADELSNGIETALLNLREPKKKKDGGYAHSASTRALMCDELGESTLPLLFYSRNGSPVTVMSFESRISTIWSPMRFSGSKDTVQGVTRIIWELFDNTHQHARVNRDHNLISHSLRGCFLDYQWVDNMVPMTNGHPLDNFMEESKSKGAIHFLFITIFDSGIGIPEHRRPTNQVGPPRSDFELLEECFGFNHGGSFNRSKGLPTVAAILGEMEIPGAAFIQTGSVSAILRGESISPISSKSAGKTGTCFSVILPYSEKGFGAKQ